jgi:hypothetical protein
MSGAKHTCSIKKELVYLEVNTVILHPLGIAPSL